MAFSLGLGKLANVFKPTATPSQAAINQQIATGGGSDTARDKVVKDDKRKKSLDVTGARVNSKQRAKLEGGLTAPAAKKKT